jgi:hypothetical protein
MREDAVHSDVLGPGLRDASLVRAIGAAAIAVGLLLVTLGIILGIAIYNSPRESLLRGWQTEAMSSLNDAVLEDGTILSDIGYVEPGPASTVMRQFPVWLGLFTIVAGCVVVMAASPRSQTVSPSVDSGSSPPASDSDEPFDDIG